MYVNIHNMLEFQNVSSFAYIQQNKVNILYIQYSVSTRLFMIFLHKGSLRQNTVNTFVFGPLNVANLETF